jgi:hypothetical protein
MPRSFELALPRLEPRVGARTPAAGDVADVDHEGELLAVHPVDHRIERDGLGLAVGRIADQGEGERRVKRGGQRRRDVRRAAGEREKKGGA